MTADYGDGRAETLRAQLDEAIAERDAALTRGDLLRAEVERLRSELIKLVPQAQMIADRLSLTVRRIRPPERTTR